MNLADRSDIDKPSSTEERPILFLHIEKTGGTSLRTALAEFFPTEEQLFGDISIELLDRFKEKLSGRVFIAGHPGRGIMSRMERALKFTVLRNPSDQAVSKYLSLCRAPTDEGHLARSLGFRDYMKRNPYMLMFQSGSLVVPFRDSSLITITGNLEDDALEALGQLDFVGCLERLDDLAACLPAILGLPGPLMIPRVNRAAEFGASKQTVILLHEEYEKLRQEPESARSIQIEYRVYERALALVQSREGMLHQLTRSSSVETGLAEPVITRRFAATDPAIRTVVGEKVDGLIRLRSKSGCGLFGPYIDLPAGICTARITLKGPHQGHVNIDIAAESGEIGVASRSIDLGAVEEDVLEISTVLSRPLWACEVRLYCESDVNADISDVEIDLAAPAKQAGAVLASAADRRITIYPKMLSLRSDSQAVIRESGELYYELREGAQDSESLLCYGPYISLIGGDYQAEIIGMVDGEFRIVVTSDYGKTVIERIVISNVVTAFEFHLLHRQYAVEMVIHRTETSRKLAIEKIELSPR